VDAQPAIALGVCRDAQCSSQSLILDVHPTRIGLLVLDEEVGRSPCALFTSSSLDLVRRLASSLR
jgi:hypothetical protein